MFILKATPALDWGIIATCLLMLVAAIVVIVSKARYLNRSISANATFMKRFRQMHEDLIPITAVQGITPAEMKVINRAPLAHLYEVGLDEIEIRAKSSAGRPLTATAVEALRAAVDAQQVEENQQLDKWMVLLTIAISGGPFIGLLGTVMGVMNTFGGVAMAGDVNVNAIAPGIAAALLATIAGLACAIPALFGYNYLNSQIGKLSDDMRIFVDRLVTRLAEAAENNAMPTPENWIAA
jgi:biopolymer transport protein ExbB